MINLWKQVLDVEEFEKKIIEQNPDLEGFSCLQMVDEIQNFVLSADKLSMKPPGKCSRK